ncbi:heterokaryon incompatibility protein-domain-containing protein [Podospora conica]|nr:heterokaryon incompatibility protein-domain-containing protein [Schizothecium conicum]
MATNSIDLYRDALENNEFRLLHLHPTDDPSSPIHCTLVKLSDPSTIEYDALSYVWGDAPDRVPARVNEVVVNITRNLDAALRQLRCSSNSRVLWVDGLCINQNNIPERNHQVMRMGDIYRHARYVRMWIGEASYVDSMAVKRFLGIRWEEHDDISTPPDPDAEAVSFQGGTPSIFDILDNDPKGRKALYIFFEQPYWGRIWVVQEVLIAVCPVLHYGYMETLFQDLQLSVFGGGLSLISYPCDRSYGLDGSRSFKFGSARNLMQKFLVSVSSQFWGSVTECGHPEFVLETRHLGATDPRDKVYGLTGLWDSALVNNAPDYSKSVASIYTEFATVLLESTGSLLLLAAAGIGELQNEPDRDIPSWVPDLRYEASYSTILVGSCRTGLYQASSRHLCHYILKPGPGPSRSTARNYLLGVKGKVCTIFHTMQDLEEAFLAISKLEQDTPPRSQLLRALFLATTFGHGITKSRVYNSWRKDIVLGFCQRLQAFNMGGSEDTVQLDILSFLDTMVTTKDFKPSIVEEYTGWRRTVTESWPPFLTDGGAYAFVAGNNVIGFCSAACRPGDGLAVVAGCPVPLVLRVSDSRDPGKYQLVGPCFVADMLQGQGHVLWLICCKVRAWMM